MVSLPVDGFINLNKPAGFTSHDCVAKVRRFLKQKRVGHGGTLDPAATGVLPIAIGRATRLLQYLSHNKAYRARIRFGVQTTTDDLEGEIIASTPAPSVTLEQVQALLPKFLGTMQQIPPSYSAIQVGGKRLYDLARAGEAVEAPVRTVEIFKIEVLGWFPGEFPELEVAIACGTGTYIRSIARDLGALLDVGGTLASLLRTESSGFLLENSLTLAELEAQVQEGTFQAVDGAIALPHLNTITLTGDEIRRWLQGQKIAVAESDQTMVPLRVMDGERLLGIGQRVQIGSEYFLAPLLVWN